MSNPENENEIEETIDEMLLLITREKYPNSKGILFLGRSIIISACLLNFIQILSGISLFSLDIVIYILLLGSGFFLYVKGYKTTTELQKRIHQDLLEVLFVKNWEELSILTSDTQVHLRGRNVDGKYIEFYFCFLTDYNSIVNSLITLNQKKQNFLLENLQDNSNIQIDDWILVIPSLSSSLTQRERSFSDTYQVPIWGFNGCEYSEIYVPTTEGNENGIFSSPTIERVLDRLTLDQHSFKEAILPFLSLIHSEGVEYESILSSKTKLQKKVQFFLFSLVFLVFLLFTSIVSIFFDVLLHKDLVLYGSKSIVSFGLFGFLLTQYWLHTKKQELSFSPNVKKPQDDTDNPLL
ncbi:MAG: hypothetical protein ACXABU_13050 [Candidatus Hodarchaeales archaeon]